MLHRMEDELIFRRWARGHRDVDGGFSLHIYTPLFLVTSDISPELISCANGLKF